MRKVRNRVFRRGDRYKWNGKLVEYHNEVHRVPFKWVEDKVFHAPPKQAKTIGEPIQRRTK